MERNFKRISEELKLPQESRERIRSHLASYQMQQEDIPMKKAINIRIPLVVAAIVTVMALTLTAGAWLMFRNYRTSNGTIAGVAKRFVMEGVEAALGRKEQQNRYRKVTGEVEAQLCLIACSEAPEGASRWTMQAIADELIRLEVVDYITDSTVCEVMKKMKSSRGRWRNGVSPKQTQTM